MNDTYLNTPIKNCRTCAHCVTSFNSPEFDKCTRFGGSYCDYTVRDQNRCGNSLSQW